MQYSSLRAVFVRDMDMLLDESQMIFAKLRVMKREVGAEVKHVFCIKILNLLSEGILVNFTFRSHLGGSFKVT